MGQVTEGTRSCVYGAADLPEDMLFWIECNPKKKSTEMTLYDDIPGARWASRSPSSSMLGR